VIVQAGLAEERMTDPHEALADERVIATCLVILTVIAVGAALAPLRPVLVPLLLALLFTWCLRPVVEGQIRHLAFPRWLALSTTVLLALALLALCGLLVVTFVTDLENNLDRYQARFKELTRQLTRSVPLERFGLHGSLDETFALSDEERKQLFNRLLTGGLSSAADLVTGGGLVMIFVLFLLVGGQPGTRRPGTLLAEIETRAQRYILQMVGFSVVTGFLVGGCLAAVGVSYAFTFGFIAFLLNFIPTVGPLIATLLPLPVVLLDPEMSVVAKVLALALPAAIQGVLAVLQPRVQGQGQDLHPVTTMAALVFFGSIWGILGAALAVPLTGVIKIILERIPTTRPAAAWMAGRLDFHPHDTPVSDPQPPSYVRER
jgi:AI-2 transport protein TqsA